MSERYYFIEEEFWENVEPCNIVESEYAWLKLGEIFDGVMDKYISKRAWYQYQHRLHQDREDLKADFVASICLAVANGNYNKAKGRLFSYASASAFRLIWWALERYEVSDRGRGEYYDLVRTKTGLAASLRGYLAEGEGIIDGICYEVSSSFFGDDHRVFSAHMSEFLEGVSSRNKLSIAARKRAKIKKSSFVRSRKKLKEALQASEFLENVKCAYER